MTLAEIFLGGSGGAVILLTLIQVSKIQINPWSTIARGIGRAVNGEVMEKLEEIEKRVGKLEVDIQTVRATDEENNIETRRVRILRFGDELFQERKHSKDHFDQILLDITRYEHYCQSHPNFENDITLSTIEHIKEVYHKCLTERTFL